MSRKLFCDYNFITYRISVWKGVLLRKIKWFYERGCYAKDCEVLSLPIKIYEHKSLIRRRLGNVDMELQENKAINLSLALENVNGIVIAPGQKFSFWFLVGKCSKAKGYRDGLVIKKGSVSKDIGGGMCQFTNMIHWLVLHSPLTIVEHHHHNNVDLFPDYGRQIPFGTGTSIMYNYLDYQFINNTNQSFQIKVYINDEYFCGELRSDDDITYSYHIKEENHYFNKVNEEYYRNNEIYRETYDKQTGDLINKELIISNHSKVIYDEKFIPVEMIQH